MLVVEIEFRDRRLILTARTTAELQDRIAAVRTLLDEVLAGTAELQTDFEGTRYALARMGYHCACANNLSEQSR